MSPYGVIRPQWCKGWPEERNVSGKWVYFSMLLFPTNDEYQNEHCLSEIHSSICFEVIDDYFVLNDAVIFLLNRHGTCFCLFVCLFCKFVFVRFFMFACLFFVLFCFVFVSVFFFFFFCLFVCLFFLGGGRLSRMFCPLLAYMVYNLANDIIYTYLSFVMRFIMQIFCILIQNSKNVVPAGLVDNKSALVSVMAWLLAGDKPLYGFIISKFAGVYIRHNVSIW